MLFQSLNKIKIWALGQSHPNAMACLNNKTSTSLSGLLMFSRLILLSLSER